MPDRDALSRCAEAIADWPQLWSPLLDEHVSGPDGRCRACRSALHVAPRWPCNIAVVALTARRLAAATG